MELELKLLLDPAEVGAFRRHPLLKQTATGKPRTQQLTSIYFDTPELYLKQNEAALRVRKVGRSWVQTFKGGGRVEAGLHQRHEWESEVGGANPDLSALRALAEADDSPLAQLLSDPTLAKRLTPIFTTEFQRTIWLLRLADGAEVELALDQGTVQHGRQQLPISEVELELKAGDAGSLFDLALALQDKVALRVGNISKAERGYGLHVPQPPAVIKAETFELDPALDVEQGFQVIAGDCLAQIQGNESGVVFGSDPESVHQMRIGLRRLRAAFDVFGRALPNPVEILAELDWLGGELGPARDWQVLADETLANVAVRCPDAPQLTALCELALRQARTQRKVAVAAVDSVRYARLMLLLASWLQGQHWRDVLLESDSETADQLALLAMPLKQFAQEKLALLQQKLRKRGKQLKHGDAQLRHRTRIAAKKTRYVAEFFQSYFPSRRTHAYLAALMTLQDTLGGANDRAVAAQLLQQLVRKQPKLAAGSGFVSGFYAADSRRELRKIVRLWHGFIALKPPVKSK
ncbi:CHAD domain-containing protein [Paraherbaspirillum soli]|uniref:CHAD domain-containing protein n=1 Tax=Paraherbaspirillum soli TaxID=631222 RepID=A0ABW0MCG5_9BURK